MVDLAHHVEILDVDVPPSVPHLSLEVPGVLCIVPGGLGIGTGSELIDRYPGLGHAMTAVTFLNYEPVQTRRARHHASITKKLPRVGYRRSGRHISMSHVEYYA